MTKPTDKELQQKRRKAVHEAVILPECDVCGKNAVHPLGWCMACGSNASST